MFNAMTQITISLKEGLIELMINVIYLYKLRLMLRQVQSFLLILTDVTPRLF